MTRVVCVHGIAQEYEARETLLAEWAPALAGGVSNAGGRLDPAEVDMAFYGLLFRPAGTKGAHAIPNFAPGDLCAGFERELLSDLYEANLPPGSAELDSKGGVARTVGTMVQAIARAPFFGGIAQQVVIWYLKQVSLFVSDPAIRAAAHKAVLDTITEDTRVVVAHSLGSVVAWEVLCAHPELPVRTLVTIGSPLGAPALLSRLEPTVTLRPGTWPAGLQRWANIADTCDVVALEKRLARVFGSRVDDSPVNNGATMHDACPYLTSAEVGRAILGGLA